MQTRETLQRKIDTARELQSIVKMMKALAAVSIRQYETAVQALADYNRTLELALQAMLCHQGQPGAPTSLIPKQLPRPQRLALVLFGSDQGMCGRFNDNLSHFAITQLQTAPIPLIDHCVFVVGQRLGDRWQELGQPLTRCFPVPGSVEGITPLVQDLVLALETWRSDYNGLSSRHALNPIFIFHNACLSNSTYHPRFFQLFPFEPSWLQELRQRPWCSRCSPLILRAEDPASSQPSQYLFSALFRQFFFVGLYRACAESLASENASRLAAMQVAEKNIAERLTALQFDFQQQRQATITEELLDIVAGFEALNTSLHPS